MKYPWRVVQLPKPDLGWYIREDDGYTYFGQGKKGKAEAERAIGDWVRAYERGRQSVKHK